MGVHAMIVLRKLWFAHYDVAYYIVGAGVIGSDVPWLECPAAML